MARIVIDMDFIGYKGVKQNDHAIRLTLEDIRYEGELGDKIAYVLTDFLKSEAIKKKIKEYING